MEWQYFHLRNGRLYDEHDELVNPEWPSFADINTAEAWLEQNDIRGNVVV